MNPPPLLPTSASLSCSKGCVCAAQCAGREQLEHLHLSPLTAAQHMAEPCDGWVLPPGKVLTHRQQRRIQLTPWGEGKKQLNISNQLIYSATTAAPPWEGRWLEDFPTCDGQRHQKQSRTLQKPSEERNRSSRCGVNVYLHRSLFKSHADRPVNTEGAEGVLSPVLKM